MSSGDEYDAYFALPDGQDLADNDENGGEEYVMVQTPVNSGKENTQEDTDIRRRVKGLRSDRKATIDSWSEKRNAYSTNNGKDGGLLQMIGRDKVSIHNGSRIVQMSCGHFTKTNMLYPSRVTQHLLRDCEKYWNAETGFLGQYACPVKVVMLSSSVIPARFRRHGSFFMHMIANGVTKDLCIRLQAANKCAYAQDAHFMSQASSKMSFNDNHGAKNTYQETRQAKTYLGYNTFPMFELLDTNHKSYTERGWKYVSYNKDIVYIWALSCAIQEYAAIEMFKDSWPDDRLRSNSTNVIYINLDTDHGKTSVDLDIVYRGWKNTPIFRVTKGEYERAVLENSAIMKVGRRLMKNAKAKASAFVNKHGHAEACTHLMEYAVRCDEVCSSLRMQDRSVIIWSPNLCRLLCPEFVKFHFKHAFACFDIKGGGIDPYDFTHLGKNSSILCKRRNENVRLFAIEQRKKWMEKVEQGLLDEQERAKHNLKEFYISGGYVSWPIMHVIIGKFTGVPYRNCIYIENRISRQEEYTLRYPWYTATYMLPGERATILQINPSNFTNNIATKAFLASDFDKNFPDVFDDFAVTFFSGEYRSRTAYEEYDDFDDIPPLVISHHEPRVAGPCVPIAEIDATRSNPEEQKTVHFSDKELIDMLDNDTVPTKRARRSGGQRGPIM